MIASIVKESRLAKGYTQQELAERTNLSLRSIQRIESGEVEPRAYTLKVLAAILDIPLQNLLNTSSIPQQGSSTTAKKVILSFGLSFLIILLAMAYAAQSTFPETHFEAALGRADRPDQSIACKVLAAQSPAHFIPGVYLNCLIAGPGLCGPITQLSGNRFRSTAVPGGHRLHYYHCAVAGMAKKIQSRSILGI